jgi:hypothetical protein
MLQLADRKIRLARTAAQVRRIEADFLIRVRTGSTSPRLRVLRRLPDGSWQSRFGGAPVKVIDAEVTVITSAGRAVSGCWLFTTTTDNA